MTRKISTAVVAALAMVAIGACGSTADPKSSANTGGSPSVTPPSKAPAAGGTVDGRTVATKMVAAMAAKKTAHTTVSTNGATIMEGDYEFGDPVKVAMRTSMSGVSMELVQVDGVIYLKGLPGLARPWIKLDPKGTDAFSKAMASVIDTSKSSDPKALASMMDGVKGKNLGTEQVDGVPTVHYAFEVPISVYGKVLGPAMLKVLQGVVTGPIASDYWVDDEDLPRKLATSMVLSGKKTTTEVTYTDWGKPVKIVAPPAAQVGTAPGK